MIRDLAERALKELEEVFKLVDEKPINAFIQEILRAKKIILIGVGREGLATRAFTMRLMHLGFDAHWIWDDTTPQLDKDDLLIATSGSGEIGHIHYVVERAKSVGARIAVVTGDNTRKTVKLADVEVFVPATVYLGSVNTVKSSQIMGNLFEQSLLLMFDCIVLEIINSKKMDIPSIVRRHRNLE
jgi:6-phospho-3-hexuloisomerase